MRWLKRDEGIVIVLVAAFLVVLLGIAGLAVDLGALYSERRQLHNGADAAALAVAEDCGRGTRPCDYLAAQQTAQWYANANSDDGASGVQVSLDITGNTGTVSVVASAYDPQAGAAGVRVPLMSLFGFHRVDVTAAATALFGYPGSASTLPLVVDREEWPGDAGGGIPDDITEFGWLAGSGCPTTISAWMWLDGSADAEPNCPPEYLRNHVADRDILLPLFIGEDEAGNRYEVAGFGYFHVTGYKLSPTGDTHTWPQNFTCEDGGPVCLRGYFFERTVSTGTPGGADFGVVLVKLVE
jgi:Flp pilus assembly protein TadG